MSSPKKKNNVILGYIKKNHRKIEIFIVAFQRSINGKFWKWFGLTSLLAFISNYNAIKTFISTNEIFPAWLNKLIVEYLLYLFPAIFFIRLFSFFALESFRYWFEITKESIYGDAIVVLKGSFGRIHSFRKFQEKNPQRLNNVLSNVCQDIKVIFDNKTRTQCSVSIKLLVDILEQPIANTKVRNVGRDRESSEKRDLKSYTDKEHSIFNNTAYNHIYTNFTAEKSESLYYINYDITKAVDYASTSFGTYCDEGDLPYKSEIVVPILPAINEEANRYKLIGFLCVDSVNIKSFDPKYDLPLLQGVADGLYDVILFHLS